MQSDPDEESRLTRPTARRILVAMRRVLLLAAALLAAAPAQAGSYNDPFAFGMTREQVEHVAQAPLIYLSGPRGSERYLIQRLSTRAGLLSGRYPHRAPVPPRPPHRLAPRLADAAVLVLTTSPAQRRLEWAARMSYDSAHARHSRQQSREETMSTLGTMEELPLDYREAVQNANTTPLWPLMRKALPHDTPVPQSKACLWPFDTIRPLLLRAGELTPVEKAERRVLILSDPGRGPGAMRVAGPIFCGMQLLLPGEKAPAHRHTPSAARIVVEGEGAYTIVNGEKCMMERGDLILTPGGAWHDHGHDGKGPVIWLDALDLPLFIDLEAAYSVERELAGAEEPPRCLGGRIRHARHGAGAAQRPCAPDLSDDALSVGQCREGPARARRADAERRAGRARLCQSRDRRRLPADHGLHRDDAAAGRKREAAAALDLGGASRGRRRRQVHRQRRDVFAGRPATRSRRRASR